MQLYSFVHGRRWCQISNFQTNMKDKHLEHFLSNSLCISSEIVLKWMPQHFTDNNSTLIQVMAWCPQATNDYVNQYQQCSMTPYGVNRPYYPLCYSGHSRYIIASHVSGVMGDLWNLLARYMMSQKNPSRPNAVLFQCVALQWRHNERVGVSNHQPHSRGPYSSA